MKKFLAMILSVVLCLGVLGGCAGEGTEASPAETATPETTASVPETTEEKIPTQSPEEEAVMKILMIGQSHAQDSVWFLQTVLQADHNALYSVIRGKNIGACAKD